MSMRETIFVFSSPDGVGCHQLSLSTGGQQTKRVIRTCVILSRGLTSTGSVLFCRIDILGHQSSATCMKTHSLGLYARFRCGYNHRSVLHVDVHACFSQYFYGLDNMSVYVSAEGGRAKLT